jgi:predicted CopG family antitoxin
MNWTDETVIVFTQLYSSNFYSKAVNDFEEKYNVQFNFDDFHGKKLKEKLESFKNVIHKMYEEKNPLGLEFLEEKYCGETEVWENPKTGKTYEVPIDIHRDFTNMVEVN